MDFVDLTQSLSVFLAIVKEVSSSFGDDGKLVLDIHGSDDENTYYKAKASQTIMSAYKFWEEPMELSYNGTLKGMGTIEMNLADIQGPPTGLTVPTAMPLPPATATPPVVGDLAIAQTGTVRSSNASIDVSTSNLEIKLTRDKKSVSPWCVNRSKEHFIEPGDRVLALAIGNNPDNLYVVDIL